MTLGGLLGSDIIWFLLSQQLIFPEAPPVLWFPFCCVESRGFLIVDACLSALAEEQVTNR